MPYVDTSSWRGSCKQGLYIALPILHGLSAIAALVMCFYCDVGRIRHQARTPGVVPYPIDTRNISAQLFLAAYPWAEDDEFVTHTWNPFALVATFQWLTAGFALRTVMGPAWNGVISTVWCVWLSLGYGLYATWSFTSFGGPFCVAMFATITASYIAAFVLCLMFVGPPSLSVLYHGGVVYAKVPPGDSDGKSQLKPGSDSTLAVWTGETGQEFYEPDLPSGPWRLVFTLEGAGAAEAVLKDAAGQVVFGTILREPGTAEGWGYKPGRYGLKVHAENAAWKVELFGE